MPKLLKCVEVYQCELCRKQFFGNGAKKQAEQCEKQGIRLPLYPRRTKVHLCASRNVYIVTSAFLDKEDDEEAYVEAHRGFVYCLAPAYNNPIGVVDEQSIRPIGKVRLFSGKPKKVKSWENYYEWDKKMFQDISFPTIEINELLETSKKN